MDEAPRRILIRSPNPVGDAVMATPAMRAVRVAHPRAEIVVMGPPQHEGLLRGLPHFDAYLPVKGRSLRDLWQRSREIRKRGFDWAVLLPDSPRTAAEAFLAGIPRRAGYARDWMRRAMVTDALPTPTENGRRVAISMIERYQRVTRALGVPDAGDACDLVVHDSSRERVAKQLAEQGVGDAPILLVTPGASFGPAKLWPVEYFAAACDEIQRRHRLLPVLLPAPSPEEEAIARRIHELAVERCVLAAPGSLEDLKAMVERSTLLLTNDTGPRHVAVALDRPVVTLMGSTDPRHTDHLLERQRVLFEDVPCRPCHQPTCAIDHRCLRRLLPERAVRAAGELLSA